MTMIRELGSRRVAAAVHALHCRLHHFPAPWLSWGARVSAPSARSCRHVQPQRGQRLLCSATSSSAQAAYTAPAPGRRARCALFVACRCCCGKEMACVSRNKAATVMQVHQ